MKKVHKIFKSLFLIFLACSTVCSAELSANQPVGILTQARAPKNQSDNTSKTTNNPIDPKNVENFAASPFKLKSAVGQVPVKTRLRIKVDTTISAETAEVGDEFRAKVLNDLLMLRAKCVLVQIGI